MLSAKADRSILERIPIVREWNGYFKLKDGSSLDILELRCKDLERVSDDELELDIMYFSKLYKTCPADLKIVSLNFPTDTIPQQRYFRRKLESTKNHVFRSHLASACKRLNGFRSTAQNGNIIYLCFQRTRKGTMITFPSLQNHSVQIL